MSTSSRYDLLFEPVQIGPVTAPNRFYQVPHCNGMGHQFPQQLAKMRGIKAEGGWGVVSTEMVEIDHASDVSPLHEGRLWDDSDIPSLALMTEAVHQHGSLAAIELCHSGLASPNLYTRTPPMGPSAVSCYLHHPVQARAMDKRDIREFRRSHRDAALRAKRAGFDIIYTYAGHQFSLLMHFLSKRFNQRTDEYGGSLENRVRLLREVLIDTKEAVGDSCAVALRFSPEELMGAAGISSESEGRAVVEMLADIPDLWDVHLSGWYNDSIPSRFAKEGFQEPYIDFVKKITDKPVVAVGRYTSADAMVSLIKRGVADMIGSARPSIADPFLPNKIREQRFDDIRECIGCNICVVADHHSVPIRCTQNPTMGEEWRRDWHPEKIAPKQDDASVLVVGAGPSGLEFTQAMSKRGYQVALAEAGTELGGRVRREASLPGLAEWIRVLDYRELYLKQAANVDIYFDSPLSAEDVLEFGFEHVVVATGAQWRKDGVGRTHRQPIEGLEKIKVFCPDDLMDGKLPEGRVVVFDDDYFYMGGVVAEMLVKAGCQVALVTPVHCVSAYNENSLDQHRIQTRLMELGVEIYQQKTLDRVINDQVELQCAYGGSTVRLDADAVVLVTEREARGSLYQDLMAAEARWADVGIKSVKAIGDHYAPGIIAEAVFSGHLAARDFGTERDANEVPFKREFITLNPID